MNTTNGEHHANSNHKEKAMNRLKRMQGILLACALVWGVVVLSPNAALGESYFREAAIDSATDDGRGMLRVAWSFKKMSGEPNPLLPIGVCLNFMNSKKGGGWTKKECTTEINSDGGQDFWVWAGPGTHHVFLATGYNHHEHPEAPEHHLHSDVVEVTVTLK